MIEFLAVPLALAAGWYIVRERQKHEDREREEDLAATSRHSFIQPIAAEACTELGTDQRSETP